MKLLFDQNLSRKLVNELKNIFPESNHVYLLGLHEALDSEIWLRTGNTSTNNMIALFINHQAEIILFGKDISLGCLQIYS